MERAIALAVLLVVCPAGVGRAGPAGVNLLPNPSFELVEPPPPTAEQAASGKPAPAEAWLPRTWSVSTPGGSSWLCPDDPGQAHSGRRCAAFHALRGGGSLRYGPMPVPDDRPWTLSFYARGKGQVVAGGLQVFPTRWDRLAQEQVFALGEAWQRFEIEVRLPAGCRQWVFDLSTRGPTEVWLDDVTLTYAGLPALGLPPDKPAAKDEHTLLHLPFEEPLNEDAFFIQGRVTLTEDGRFGKAITFGPEGYVACSANEGLDSRRGTVEVWVKLLAPGNDGVYHRLVGVPGPEGVSLAKDQYSHVAFGFSSGWSSLSYIRGEGYAYHWQPGVWRHVAACWDEEMMQLFVDGKLIAWKERPRLSRALGPELGIGGAGLALDDLRISNVVRYRLPVPLAE